MKCIVWRTCIVQKCLFSQPKFSQPIAAARNWWLVLRHARRSRQEGAALQSFRSGCNLAEEATFIFIVEIKEHRKQAGYRSGHQTRHASAVYSPLMRLCRVSAAAVVARCAQVSIRSLYTSQRLDQQLGTAVSERHRCGAAGSL